MDEDWGGGVTVKLPEYVYADTTSTLRNFAKYVTISILQQAKNTGDFGRHHDYEQSIIWAEHDYFSIKLQAHGYKDEDYWLCTIYSPNMILLVRVRSSDEEVVSVAKIDGTYI